MGDLKSSKQEQLDRMLNVKLNRLIERLKKNPEVIDYTEVLIKNGDILRLIEATGAKSKTDAIQIAVKCAIEFFEDKKRAEKLGQLRYAEKEKHEDANSILDADNVNRHYMGKFRLTKDKGLVL